MELQAKCRIHFRTDFDPLGRVQNGQIFGFLEVCRQTKTVVPHYRKSPCLVEILFTGYNYMLQYD